MLADWPTMTATCWTPRRIGSPTWARGHALASQGEVRTPAVAAAARPLPISDREREIAMLVVAGCSNREVADRLFVSVRTVEGHLYRIFAKLGIDDRDQLVHLLRLERSGELNAKVILPPGQR